MSLNRPWMKFYPADWRADELLGMCSLAARGLWIEMIGIMHTADPYGHLLVHGRPPTDTQLAALARCPLDQIRGLLHELESAGVYSRTRKGVIYSRRMTRDEKRSNDGRTGKITGRKVPGSRNSQRLEKAEEKSATLKVDRKVIDPPPSPHKLDKSSDSSLRSESAAGPLDLKRELWNRARRLLMADGCSDARARKLMGMWAGKHSHGKLLDVLASAEAKAPAGDIVGYIQGALRCSDTVPMAEREQAELVWRAELTRWRLRGFDRSAWPAEKGPAPGLPGCRVPHHLLAEFNLLPEPVA